MGKLIFNDDKIANKQEFIKLCPFGAIEYADGKLSANAACRMCRMCEKKGPIGAVTFVEDSAASVDKSLYSGIAVFAEQIGGRIQPVTLELIGKARELADQSGQQVFAVCLGNSAVCAACGELPQYGADRVYMYLDGELTDFKLDSYASVLKSFAEEVKPSTILVGATTVGRQLAPRLAAKLKTGLTADCTSLEIEEGTDLLQIRPAFGGNIMACIHTPKHRPQMATVRPKVMETPKRDRSRTGELIKKSIDRALLASGVNVLEVSKKPQELYIEDADVIVAAGRGIKKKEDLAMLEQLAQLLHGQLAGTRPMVENGLVEPRRQIGLSGRTVRPKLIITCGVSGAIQFVAGMNNSDTIIAINSDPAASIFRVAHYGIVGDMYKIIPALIEKIKAEGDANVEL